MVQTEAGLPPIWLMLVCGAYSLGFGGFYLFRARAFRDRVLRIYEERQGWFWSFGRWILLRPGYVMGIRVTCAGAMLMGLFLLWIGGSGLASGRWP